MDRSVVGLEIDGSTAWCGLNRPAVHNAVDEAVMAGLKAPRRSPRLGVRAVILTGAGAGTSRRRDLRYLATSARGGRRAMCNDAGDLDAVFFRRSWFTIAAINATPTAALRVLTLPPPGRAGASLPVSARGRWG